MITKEESKIKELTILGLYFPEIDHSLFQQEVWSMNDYFMYYKNDITSRITKCFQIHKDISVYEQGSRRLKGDIIAKYNELGVEIVTCEPIPDLVNQTVFPINDITIDPNLFTSSMIYMLQYAELLGYNKINIMGVKLLTSDEHSYQAPALLKTMEILRGRGIKISVYRPEWEVGWKFFCNAKRIDWKAIKPIDMMYGSQISTGNISYQNKTIRGSINNDFKNKKD
jgi:hypothetical protein